MEARKARARPIPAVNATAVRAAGSRRRPYISGRTRRLAAVRLEPPQAPWAAMAILAAAAVVAMRTILQARPAAIVSIRAPAAALVEGSTAAALHHRTARLAA